MEAKRRLSAIPGILEKIDFKLRSFLYKTNPRLYSKLHKRIVKAVDYINRSIAELRVDDTKLAEALYSRVSRLQHSLEMKGISIEKIIVEVEKLTSYLIASYWDFSGRINIVRKAYRRYLLSFVIALVLAPIFIKTPVMLLGILLFPLFISIHAFRARRRLGILIASALIPFTMFVDAVAIRGSLATLIDPEELHKAASGIGVPEGVMVLILVLIIIAASISFFMAVKSFITLYRNIEALI